MSQYKQIQGLSKGSKAHKYFKQVEGNIEGKYQRYAAKAEQSLYAASAYIFVTICIFWISYRMLQLFEAVCGALWKRVIKLVKVVFGKVSNRVKRVNKSVDKFINDEV